MKLKDIFIIGFIYSILSIGVGILAFIILTPILSTQEVEQLENVGLIVVEADISIITIIITLTVISWVIAGFLIYNNIKNIKVKMSDEDKLVISIALFDFILAAIIGFLSIDFILHIIVLYILTHISIDVARHFKLYKR